ncbi:MULTISPECIES: glutamine--fructose-6-phosphate transaminase (isomerizing) [unclassified Haladaptatus]|uniref:glutamine--fructose-6-phosphate transaminase (isomerizing) n=1 Tax=unclassified Haladaptatus TaxID=2622732 RepID=UPI0023E88BA4|nr:MULTISPECIES: glutamine--fructose-6-phosphate transaminase (isomerizing) [unclassified Haladaptatus]
MCGIIARIGRDDAFDEILTGLENLEYRGYDSAGIAIQNGTGIKIRKEAGEISELKNLIGNNAPNGNAGIGHTRWSTHGEPTQSNAHPHEDCTGDIAVVHNGIIENYETLRKELKAKGHEFTSETDTEVIPHLIEEYKADGLTTDEAFRQTVADLEGSYAIAMLPEGEKKIYTARQGSPLVVGISDGEYYIASDVPAFLDFTDQVMFVEEGDVVIVDEDGVSVTDLAGNPVDREIEEVEWDAEDAEKDGYDHYMQKEIFTQPEALAKTIKGRVDVDNEQVTLEDFPPGTFEDVDHVQFVACGTSYHAAMYGAHQLSEGGVHAQPFLASEYNGQSELLTEDSLVIAVTQSGETADTMSALRLAKECGARTLAVTNVVGSSAAREADDALFIRAGPEIGVAATKTFSSQAVTLTLLAERVLDDVPNAQPTDDRKELLKDIDALPRHIDQVLETTRAAHLIEEYVGDESFFFIGRGLGHPTALEGALKFKEITYEHAEGFAAGELKHGPLALVTDKSPVFAILTGNKDEKTIQNAEEAAARGAPVITIGKQPGEDVAVADAHLAVPDTHPKLSALLSNVHLQLLSYHMAAMLDRSIDKPRNLAKSVTVE